MIGGGCLCNRIETDAGRAGIPNPLQPFDRPSKLVGADMRLSRPADCKQPHTAMPESSRRHYPLHARDCRNRPFPRRASAF